VGGEYYQTWAHYFVKFLDAYKEKGINMWGLTVENEPLECTGPKYPFNCLLFSKELQRDFVKLNLGPTLEKAGYGKDKVKLMIFDENRGPLVEWADTILNDKNASKYVSGIAFHWYSNNDKNLVNLDTTHQKHPEYFLLASEACLGGNKPNIGNWNNGEWYAFDIITDLNHHTTGWLDWNMALDTNSHPRWAKGGSFESPLLVNASAKEYYKQPTYYSMGHFSKFLPPDSVRVELNVDLKIDNLLSVALVRPDNATVVIVQNKNQEPVDLTINSKQGVISHTISANGLQSYIWM